MYPTAGSNARRAGPGFWSVDATRTRRAAALSDTAETADSITYPLPIVKRDLGWIASLLGVSGYFLFLNLTIPLYADDYWYSLSFGTIDHLESLTDVFVSQWRHYFEWGGRSVAHTIGQLALLGPLWVFRVFNTIAFALLNALIAFHATRSGGQRPGWLLFLISTCLFWLAVPKLGETTLWLMGSVNYLWNAVFILLFLLITTKTLEAERRKPLLIGSHVIFGLLAGWGYETTSLTGLSVAILLGTFYSPERFTKRLVRLLPGFSAYLIGYIFLLAAPGNSVRSAMIGRESDLITTMLSNFPRFVGLHALSIGLLLVLLGLAVRVIRNSGWRPFLQSRALLFAAAGLMNNGLMLAAPAIPMRSGFGGSVFFVLSAVSMAAAIRDKRRWPMITVATLVILVSACVAVPVGRAYWKLHVLDIERRALASAARKSGLEAVEWPLPDVQIDGRVFARDIRPSPKYWVNQQVADFYGFREILGEQPQLDRYPESKPMIDTDVLFGESRLIEISSLESGRGTSLFFVWDFPEAIEGDELNFRFRYQHSHTPSWKRQLINLLPDSYGRFLWEKVEFNSRWTPDGEMKALEVFCRKLRRSPISS